MKILFTLLFFFTINLIAKEKKQILLLNSYHESMPWVENIKKGVFSVLNPTEQEYEFFIENMDTKRYSDAKYYKTLSKLYKTKYKNINFDLILSSDNNALDFLKKYRDTIFGDVPVSFSGVNEYKDSMIKGYSNYTGVSEKLSLEKNIQLILKLHPNVKNIYFINDDLKTGQLFKKNMKLIAKKYSNKINLIYNKNLSVEDLKHDVSLLKEGTVILLGAYFSDKNNKYISFEKMGSYVLSSSKVPIYCVVDLSLTQNIIGGYVLSSFSQGVLMAQLGKKILDGIVADDLRVIKDDANQYIFNATGLKYYNIDRKQLPENSKIINDRVTYYDQFENILRLEYIVIIIITMVLLLFIYKKMIFNEKGILNILVYGPLFFLPLVIGILIYNVVQYNDKVYKNDIQRLKSEYLKEQQKISFNEIEKTIKYISNMKIEMTNQLKSDLKNRVDEAYIIASNIYKENKNTKSDKEIQKIIIDALSKIRFFDGRGYYFINTNKGKGILFNGISKLDSPPDLYNLQDRKGGFILRKQIDIVKNSGAGYLYNYFTKIDTTSSEELLKLSYIREFKPFNWHIGTGEYLDDLNENIKTRIYNYISNLRYGINGYLFAFTPKGIVVSHGDSSELVGKDMYTKVDTNGVYYTQEIIKNAMLNNSKFTKFGWFNKETQKIDTKYAYATYMKKYNIIIGTGVFANDVQKIIDSETLKLNQKNNEQIEQILIISMIVLVFVLILSFILSNTVKRIFQGYNHKLNDLNISLEHRIKKEISASQEKDNLIYQQSKMASMGEMIGNIAHQWRQPLGVISVGATGLKMQQEYGLLNDKFLITTCDSINENAQYLSKTIDDFKNFIKNDRDKVEFNLKENIESFLTLVTPSIKNHQINIHLDLDDTLVLNSYPNELTQCFMNLFNNAKDALLNNKEEKYLFITAKRFDKKLCIIFKDNAGGVDEKIKDKIFEPYFTTKHKSQGTGLGLSMTYKIIVEGMNGSIEIKNTEYSFNSKNYKGAEFRIIIDLNT